jgi:glucose/arabinose dehydrogenase
VNHIYIVEQTGRIRSLDLGTNQLSTFFTLQGLTSTSGEQGLLGMAFDPNYASNGKFYLNFTVPGGAFGNGVTHVSQFQLPPVKKKKKKKKKRSSTEVVLLTYVHPQANHNGGWIGFSPRSGDDNNLYIATGDGGNATIRGRILNRRNAQSNTTLLGKCCVFTSIRRPARSDPPSDNPFFSSGTFRREIWALRLGAILASFDRQTGRMCIWVTLGRTRAKKSTRKATNRRRRKLRMEITRRHWCNACRTGGRRKSAAGKYRTDH